MDLYRIISELIAERDKVVRIIESLESMTLESISPGSKTPGTKDAPQRTAQRAPRKRGRKFMDSAARREVSERMKLYWAKRRKDAEQTATGSASA